MEGTSPVTLTEGQPAPEPNIGTIVPEPVISDTGQASADTGQGQAQAPTTPDEPTFFDPSTLTEELKPAYKQMQAAFTKKMQALSEDRQKIDAYNSFMSDPIGQMQQVARQYGYALTRAEAAAQLQQQQQTQQQQWEPNSWDEVSQRIRAEAREEILRELQPLIGSVQKVTAQQIEKQLSEIDPEWAKYQDEMRATLQEFPKLANDPAKLYKLSVPDEVLHSRAIQQALSKFQSKTGQAKVSGSTKTSQTAPAPPDVSKMSSREAFNWAVENAKKQIGGR